MCKRYMLRRKVLLSVLCVLTMSLCGCLNARSPDEYGYALIIGIDRGQSKPYYVSMLLQRSNGDAQSGGENRSPISGVECDDLFEGIALLESGLPFALNLSRTSAMVFSYDIAKSGDIEDFLSVSLGSLQIRYYANLIIAYSSAEEFLSGIRSELSPNVAKLQYSFVEYGEETGLVPSITLAEFYDRAWSGSSDVLVPLGSLSAQGDEDASEAEEGGEDKAARQQASNVQDSSFRAVDLLGSSEYLPESVGRTGGLKSSMIGGAVFKDTRLVGFLNGKHTQSLLMATGQFVNGHMQLEINGNNVSIALKKNGAPRTTLRLGEKPYAQFFITLDAFLERPSAVQDMDGSQIEEMIEKSLRKEMNDVFYACRDSDADVFGLGKQAIQLFRDTRLWEAYDWHAAYMKADADFIVDVTLSYNPTKSRLE